MSNLSKTENYDVVIVGMGPTGLVLANLLGLEKLNVLVIDKFLTPYDLPRAVHLDDEIMRILQVIGVASEMEKIMRPNLGMRFVDADNNLLLDWPRPQEIGKNGWKPSYKFHQPDLERVLYKNLKRFPNVEIRKGFEATEVKNEDEKVEVKILKLEENDACRVRCDFIVGCDGARSFIRKKMGVKYEEMGFFEDWLVVDIILKKDRSDLGLFSIQFCGTSQPATYSPGTRGRLRWEFALKDQKSHEDILKTDYVWNLLSRWITPDEAKIERKAIYTFKSSLAEQWVKGRLILAGDSAHLTPPFM
jgi:3-(3-hydroxy-phenyl)propionate hydroxylase